jgi:uncharacterized protein with NAD-binding domain and iron-sulfur cluster
MIARVGTVETQAVQLWLTPTLEELGGVAPGVVAGTYAEPLDTWADMSELLPREDWPADGPKTILYFCGPKPGGEGPPPSDTSYPAAQQAAVAQTARTCSKAPRVPSCRGRPPGNPAGLDWSLLFGARDEPRRGRPDTQYVRANTIPRALRPLLSGSTRSACARAARAFEPVSGRRLGADRLEWLRGGGGDGCSTPRGRSGIP